MSHLDQEALDAARAAQTKAPEGMLAKCERIIWHDDGTRRFVFGYVAARMPRECRENAARMPRGRKGRSGAA